MNTLLTITEFIGRFHPVLVHLPIGILLLAVIFYFISVKRKNGDFNTAIKYALLIGFAAGLLSCITGYLLSSSGDYNEVIVSRHQWMGIITTLISGIAFYFYDKKNNLLKWIMPLMALLIIVTGHLGGSLTHGEDYLTKGLSSPAEKNIVSKPIPNVQQAVVYNDIVQPILQSKCYNCHGPNKQKGKLRLDEPSFIDKGGKDGKVIIAGNAGESELIKRILLPEDNEDRMPPKEKPQLTKAQIELLNWWVSSGADYHKKTAELNQPDKVKAYLAALQNDTGQKAITTTKDIPEGPVEKAPDDIIQKLRGLDVAVTPVSQNSNYLQVNFVAVDSVTSQQLQLLRALNKQISWLKLGGTQISDSVFTVIENLKNLTRLYLNKTNVTNKTIAHIKNLSQLQYLNLSETTVGVDGLIVLKGLANLRSLFLYKTNISAEALEAIKKTFPQALIDTGGYKVAFLATDTMEVKETSKKN